jgi:hypothetical protein
MTKSFYAGSAKIYQFPTRVHPDLGGRSGESKASGNLPAANLAPVRIANVAFGSAWYHEEAVEEAKGASKN